ncbi:malic enzyme-like NAD(P)-binding protein [Streptomyces sp. RPT161]|uniref:malic enzyme-like NAD(P)-binding protein n=1 Tax=Streptomyces sp. RPT161 TaxID=3015993 RepID=UPI0022B915E0|nr:malic enzyme-like NAD(P)-binding protein [Streptomyces sp. RPT161]
MTTAVSVTGAQLGDPRLVVLGAGSAAVGVADMIRTAVVDEGLSGRCGRPVLVRGHQRAAGAIPHPSTARRRCFRRCGA